MLHVSNRRHGQQAGVVITNIGACWSNIWCCRYPEGDLDTNLTIVITNVGADFTRLGSFGDAEQFGGQLVAQMDRSYLNRSWNKPKTPPQVTTSCYFWLLHKFFNILSLTCVLVISLHPIVIVLFGFSKSLPPDAALPLPFTRLALHDTHMVQ